MKVVALEEHFVVPELLDAWKRLPQDDVDEVSAGFGEDPISRQLRDVGEDRIAAMDDQGVDVQVLSLNSPGVQNLPPADAVSVARQANDALSEMVASQPDRFQGFAAIPTPDPEAAARELERAITTLKFRGALLNGRTGSVNADDIRFDDLYQAAARLRAPLYLHPQTPVRPVRTAYYSGLGEQLDAGFANYGIGWHYETGVQLLRMIFAGVFDRYPDLQVILGHWGEAVLFYLERIAMLEHLGLHLQRPLADYFRTNVWITGSGLMSARYLRWSAEVIGVDRILYATDYPFIPTGGGQARHFLESADLTDTQKTAIGSGAWDQLTAHLA